MYQRYKLLKSWISLTEHYNTRKFQSTQHLTTLCFLQNHILGLVLKWYDTQCLTHTCMYMYNNKWQLLRAILLSIRKFCKSVGKKMCLPNECQRDVYSNLYIVIWILSATAGEAVKHVSFITVTFKFYIKHLIAFVFFFFFLHCHSV